MRTGNCLLNISAVLAIGFLQAGFEAPTVRAQSAVILTGYVSSAEEGPMEGVVVSARKDGATITVSVVTDKEGKYTFPAARLEPGRYQLSIRAGGYELESPKGVDLSAAQSVTAEIKLRATSNVVSQLTDGEWLANMPGTWLQQLPHLAAHRALVPRRYRISANLQAHGRLLPW
jgi:hypothetical protein